MLSATGDFWVTVADRAAEQLAELSDLRRVEHLVLDVGRRQGPARRASGPIRRAFTPRPYHLTFLVAEAAKAAGVHYLDLTEDVASTRKVKALAAGASTAFIPQCGLAPGFISIVAAESGPALRRPARCPPARRRPAEIPVQRAQLQPDLVHRRGDQRVLRAVRSHRRWHAAPDPAAGGMRGLLTRRRRPTRRSTPRAASAPWPRPCAAKVRNLNYRTIRYPGHAAIMKALSNDLRLRDRPGPLEGHPGKRRPRDPAGRGHRLRHRLGDEGRPFGAGDLHQQDLRPRDGRADGERDPDHHRLGDLRRARSAGRWRRAHRRLRAPGGDRAAPTSSPTVSAAPTPPPSTPAPALESAA